MFVDISQLQGIDGTYALLSDIPSTPILSAVLTAGNSTSSNNIVVTDGDEIQFGVGGDKIYKDGSNFMRLTAPAKGFIATIQSNIEFLIDSGGIEAYSVSSNNRAGFIVNSARPTIYANNGSWAGTLDMTIALTTNRTWDFPDKNGTVALTSDISDSIYTASGIVPTSVNATLTDNFAFNTDLLYLDGPNNSIGMGTTATTSSGPFSQGTNRLYIDMGSGASTKHGITVVNTSNTGYPFSTPINAINQSSAITSVGIMGYSESTNTSGYQYGIIGRAYSASLNKISYGVLGLVGSNTFSNGASGAGSFGVVGTTTNSPGGTQATGSFLAYMQSDQPTTYGYLSIPLSNTHTGTHYNFYAQDQDLVNVASTRYGGYFKVIGTGANNYGLALDVRNASGNNIALQIINGGVVLGGLTTTPAAGYVLQSTDANGTADWVDPSTLISAPTLSAVLTAGNTTGANNIVLSTDLGVRTISAINATTPTDAFNLGFSQSTAYLRRLDLLGAATYWLNTQLDNAVVFAGNEQVVSRINSTGFTFFVQNATGQKKFYVDDALDFIIQDSNLGVQIDPVTLTANRVQLLQDADGTIALLSDIPAGAGDNIYNTNGTLTGNRFVTTGTNIIGFEDGSNSVRIDPSNHRIGFKNGGIGDKTGWITTNGTLTADQTYTLQNASGTLAFLSDIPAPTQAGHVIYDAPSPTPLTQRTKLVFSGAGVTATDANDLTYGNHTLVNIPGADGNGIFDAANDGGTVPTGFDVNLTDTFTFNTNLLKIDAGVNKNIGIGTAFPQAYTKINVVTTEPGQYIAMQIVSNTGTNVNEAIRAEATSSNPVTNFGLVARAGLASSRNVGIQGNVTGGNTTLANIAVEGNCAVTNIGSAGNNGKNYGFETYVDNANSQNVGQLIQVGTQVNIGGDFDTGSEIYMSNTGSLANTSYGMRIQQTKTDTTTKYGAFINTYEIGGTRSTGTTYGLKIQANDNFTSSGNLYALDIAGFTGTNLANAVAIRTNNGDVNFQSSGNINLFYLNEGLDGIGIGTSSPLAAAILHINGNTKLEGGVIKDARSANDVTIDVAQEDNFIACGGSTGSTLNFDDNNFEVGTVIEISKQTGAAVTINMTNGTIGRNNSGGLTSIVWNPTIYGLARMIKVSTSFWIFEGR